ncbi:MAG: glycerol kinase [Cognaticolwellia sp.]
MPRDIVLAIDQGTTGSTALLLSQDLRVLATQNVEFPNHYPKPGHVEHDIEEIWASIAQAVSGAMAKADIGPERIAAIGITNQRETSLFWDPKTGQAANRALVWQDRRTADRCQALKDAGHETLFKERTGLVLDPYFSGTKASWMLENVPGLREKAYSGQALFGTIDSWLTHRLTGVHVTDTSNASRTLMMSLHSLEWDPELLDILGVPAACLPKICDSSQVYGHTKNVPFLPDGIPVAGLIGDQQGALFGQACFSQGMAKCTYGTGAFVLLNTGSTITPSQHGMLTTVAWRVNGEVQYALEGSAFIAGAAVQWLRDGLGVIRNAAEIEDLAATVPDSGGVVFVPALAGLGAPHWKPEARGLLWGLTGGTTKAHIARAVLDGIALQIGDILRAMSQDLGAPLKELRVDGGAARNDMLMQRQCDVLETPCVRPMQLETTALGSAFLAGLAVGLWKSQDELAATWREDRVFKPIMDAQEREALIDLWTRAVERA